LPHVRFGKKRLWRLDVVRQFIAFNETASGHSVDSTRRGR
jgi:hypothetical protein